MTEWIWLSYFCWFPRFYTSCQVRSWGPKRLCRREAVWLLGSSSTTVKPRVPVAYSKSPFLHGPKMGRCKNDKILKLMVWPKKPESKNDPKKRKMGIYNCDHWYPLVRHSLCLMTPYCNSQEKWPWNSRDPLAKNLVALPNMFDTLTHFVVIV